MTLLEPRRYRLDDLLRRPYTATTPFGSSGNCLWATSPQGWGFSGGVHWVHRTTAEGLAPFTIRIEANGTEVTPGDALYRPSHVTQHGRDAESELQVTEDKFITQDDVVVSVLSFRNPSDGIVDVTLDVRWGISAGENNFRKNIPVYVHRIAPPGDDLHQSLAPGSRFVRVVVMAFAPTKEEAIRRANRWVRDPDAARHQAEAYQAWFDENVPRFDCSDPWLTKMWYHRWYVVKKNHMNPGVGLTLEDSFSEGRWGSDWYSASITYGAGHVLRETRWLREPSYARNYFRGFARNQRADGLYRSWYVDGIARPTGDEGKYTDWITAAIADVDLVHPDTDFLREMFPVLQKNVEYWQSHSWDGDGLLVVDSHWWTGMEWAPSFFYKADYRLGEDRAGMDVQHPVKRMDLTAYQYANLSALARIATKLGDTATAAKAIALAAATKAATLEKAWDTESGFFYDLMPGTDEKILSGKNIAGFYPFYSGLADTEQVCAFRHLTDPQEFWTAYPPASAAQSIPAFHQDRLMRDKPVTGCYWNGPTWPHANSLVITGLARSLREQGETAHAPDARKTLLTLLESFGRAQFEGGDFDRPHTGEFYRGDTAAWQTAERDYHHSTWADLIITGIVGLVPREDEILELHPLLPSRAEGGWSHFCLEELPYRGRLLTIVWDDPTHPEDFYEDGDKGLTILVDGKRFWHQETLSPLQIALPPA